MLIQVDTGSFVNFYDLLTVGVLPQARRDLGHAIAARAPLQLVKTHHFHASMCIKAS
jgi:hypothetical protein